MIHEQPVAKDVAPKYKPLMEGGVQVNMACFACGHNVPLFLDDDRVFIAGHSYDEKIPHTTYQHANQIGGGTVSIPSTHYETETRHCGGGSMKIVGIIDEYSGEGVTKDFKIPDGYKAVGFTLGEKVLTIRVRKIGE